jgi:hypothetical protein
MKLAAITVRVETETPNKLVKTPRHWERSTPRPTNHLEAQ